MMVPSLAEEEEADCCYPKCSGEEAAAAYLDAGVEAVEEEEAKAPGVSCDAD